jgi:hypothetical protein
MTDFKHVDEQIEALDHEWRSWAGTIEEKKGRKYQNYRDTMQALLDGARWIQRIAKQPLLDEMPEEYEGGDPEGAYDSIVIEARDALAKLQEQK